jgi:ATP:corrinoid adenosyltransferase
MPAEPPVVPAARPSPRTAGSLVPVHTGLGTGTATAGAEVAMVRGRSEGTGVTLTGGDAPAARVALADTASGTSTIRPSYHRGVVAGKGIGDRCR